MPKGVSLRQWACGSYDPRTGRSASAYSTDATIIEDQKVNPSSQVSAATGTAAGGTPSWTEIDKNRSRK
jgi:hypothetical protein